MTELTIIPLTHNGVQGVIAVDESAPDAKKGQVGYIPSMKKVLILESNGNRIHEKRQIVIRAEKKLGLPVDELVIPDKEDIETKHLNLVSKWSFKSEEELNLVLKGMKLAVAQSKGVYTEEDMRNAFDHGVIAGFTNENLPELIAGLKEECIKSLKKLPVKLIIHDDGREEFVY